VTPFFRFPEVQKSYRSQSNFSLGANAPKKGLQFTGNRKDSTNAAIERITAFETDRADIANIEAKTDEVTVAAKVKRNVEVLEVIEGIDLIETEQL